MTGLPIVALMMGFGFGPGDAHWSFVPPKRPSPPSVRDAGWVRNTIDAFILSRLEAEGLKPSPEADRPTLIRRLSFDLIGLPPLPEEVEAFVKDVRPDAYERLVDRLLASQHHGERWAQHWLDLARYADSDGYEYDQARPDMWRYRDWVVEALNRDLPYDQFLRMQLAGDEAAPGDPKAFIATGFNRLYPDMVDLNDQGLRRQNALNDITETTGAVVLGLTIGCARCHDHKTDPILQRDFYALQAFFAPAQFCDDVVIAPTEERAKHEAVSRTWTEEVGRSRAAILAIEATIREKLASGLPPGLSDDASRAFAKAENDRNTEDVRLIFEATRKDSRIKKEEIAAGLDERNRSDWETWTAKLDALLKSAPHDLARARGLDESPGFLPSTYLLRRGDYTNRGPEVAPAFPKALTSGEPPTITPRGSSSGRRSTLVDWLVKSDHPLTSRVLVNRLWQHHFGRGIVATPGDFGILGEEPSHPELLDWLSREFVAKGWSLKKIHRLMVTSAAYRQSSRFEPSAAKVDPANALLWRHSRARLDGEAIRGRHAFLIGQVEPRARRPVRLPRAPERADQAQQQGGGLASFSEA